MKANGDSHTCCSSDNKVLIGMCDCMVDNDIGTSDFSLVLVILYVYGNAHVRSHVSPGMG